MAPGLSRKRGNWPLTERLEPRILLSAGWDVVLIDGSPPGLEELVLSAVHAERVVLYDCQKDSAADLLSRVTDLGASRGRPCPCGMIGTGSERGAD